MCSQASFQSPGQYQEDSVWGRTLPLSAVRGVLRAPGGHSCPLCALQQRRWTSVLTLPHVRPFASRFPVATSAQRSVCQRRLTRVCFHVSCLARLLVHADALWSVNIYVLCAPATMFVCLFSSLQHICSKCGMYTNSRTCPVWLCRICQEQQEVRGRSSPGQRRELWVPSLKISAFFPSYEPLCSFASSRITFHCPLTWKITFN